MTGFEWLNQVRTRLRKLHHKVRIPQLCALTPKRDPFYAARPEDTKWAKWFAEMWKERYQGQSGVYLRDMHYKLQALSNYPKLNGKVYENTKADWMRFCQAASCARPLHLVPVDAFVDERAPKPAPLNWETTGEVEPRSIPPSFDWPLPEVHVDFSLQDWEIGTPEVKGYAPNDQADRFYYLELWVEKSGENETLARVCEELGIQFIPSKGFQSISNAIRLLERIREVGKPTRIFYVSDYDRNGRVMPVSVSRQIEFYLKEFVPGADIKILPLALTAAQVRKYDKLIPSPVDGKSIELDALEAFYPGELERIVRAAVAPYLDETLDRQRWEAQRLAREIVQREWRELLQDQQQEFEVLQKGVRRVTTRYKKKADELNRNLQRDLAPFRKPLRKLESECAARAASFNPKLPARPLPKETSVSEENWLFDSSRCYFEQLKFYKVQREDRIPDFLKQPKLIPFLKALESLLERST